MGGIWLVNIPDWLEDAGLPYRLYKGWETRARSSGGYDDVRAIGYHHDATSPSSNPASAEAYMWENADSRPIGALYIRRDGSITVGAAGATNTMGKGGPIPTSQGTISLDKGNQYMVAIEAANNGVGEAWSKTMLDNYFTLCAILCERLGLKASDCYSHWEYCNPSCPGRKIDPAGPTPSYPEIGGTSGAKIWSTPGFRDRVTKAMGQAPEPTPTPPAPPVPKGVSDMLPMIGKYPNHGAWVVSLDGGITHKAIRNKDWANAVIAGGAVAALARKVVTDWGQVGDFASTSQAQTFLGANKGTW